MRDILIYLIGQIQECEYYNGQNIVAFVGVMDEDELIDYILKKYQPLEPNDKFRIVKLARGFLPIY